jgi:predicted nucleotidyltransferase
VKECGPCPVFASFTLAFALQLRKKHEKTFSQGKKNLIQVKRNLSQSRVCILSKTPTHYKALTNPHITKPTHTHTTNNIKPPQYKLKQNA